MSLLKRVGDYEVVRVLHANPHANYKVRREGELYRLTLIPLCDSSIH